MRYNPTNAIDPTGQFGKAAADIIWIAAGFLPRTETLLNSLMDGRGNAGERFAAALKSIRRPLYPDELRILKEVIDGKFNGDLSNFAQIRIATKAAADRLELETPLPNLPNQSRGALGRGLIPIPPLKLPTAAMGKKHYAIIQRAESLVRQLGDEDFGKRQVASAELAAILKDAIQNDPVLALRLGGVLADGLKCGDDEIVRRIEQILKLPGIVEYARTILAPYRRGVYVR
jgi:hypothetical protein